MKLIFEEWRKFLKRSEKDQVFLVSPKGEIYFGNNHDEIYEKLGILNEEEALRSGYIKCREQTQMLYIVVSNIKLSMQSISSLLKYIRHNSYFAIALHIESNGHKIFKYPENFKDFISTLKSL